jgi:hypothetical protein
VKYLGRSDVERSQERMSTAPLAEALVSPERAIAAAADRRSWLPPILVATAASLLVAAIATPRIDFERPVVEVLDRDLEARQQLSPHEVEEKLAQATRVGAVAAYARGLFAPALAACAASVALALAFRVAGARAPFRPTLAVASWGLLPLALRSLLVLPAVWRMHDVAADDVDRALPSSLGALVPASAAPRLASLAHAIDLFSLWAVALVALGMAHVARTSRARAFVVVGVLWASYVALVHVALPGLLPGAGAAR